METFSRGLLATALLAISCQAGAVVIGDKDWRQLAETVNFTWNEVNSVCGSGYCAGGVGELATLNGWYWAGNEELNSLLEFLVGGALSDQGDDMRSFEGSSPGIVWALDQFTPTYADSLGRYVFGWSRSFSTMGNGPFVASFASWTLDPPETAAIGALAAGAENERIAIVGVWLYRPVPEPGTLALLALGLAGLGLSRRRKAN